MSTIYETLNNSQIEPCIKELGVITASDAHQYDYFGNSVSVYGNRLAVGAYSEDTSGSDVGKVYIYEWNKVTKTYDEITQVLPHDPQASDYFGFSVALYENRLIVGAPLQDSAAVDSGKVYIYDWDDQTNQYDIVSAIVSPEADVNDLFGQSVALEGNRLIVGAGAEDTSSPNGGKVYIYDWVDTNTGYAEVQRLVASDAASDDYFGASVSLYGNKLVVGAYLKDSPSVDVGKVYVYEWNFNTNSYVEISQLTASDAEVSDYFGASVSLYGNRLIVGAVGVDTPEWSAGKIYVYEWDSGTRQFIEKIKITASDIEAGDFYGSSVALFNNRLVVGAQFEDTATTDAGKVYIYDICTILKKINTTEDQSNETNIDWIQNGERAGDLNLNRPVKQVSDVINNVIEHLANLDQVSYEDIERIYIKKDEVNIISVKKYGAIGNGIEDDTIAIQTAVSQNIGKTIYFPSGTYKITSTILQDTTGLGDVSVCKFIGDSMTNTIIDNASNGAAIKVTSGTGAEFAYDLEISNLKITSYNNTPGSIGVEIGGCRSVKIDHTEITGLNSHGIYAYSSVGDFTDTSHVKVDHSIIEYCGGYGIYIKTDGDAVHNGWNVYESRIGLCTLGGVLTESLVNSEFKNCGIYYNNGFGLKITSGSGSAPTPKIIIISNCEFDNNEGVQIDVEVGNSILITLAYLIDNNILPTFTTGVRFGAGVISSVISQLTPRLNPLVTNKVVAQIDSGAIDIVIRDSNYQGWSSLNGQFYVDNTSGEVVIDDRLNRKAKTLTIGNTSKSIDGSSDVSWSLPEIGINISTEAQARAGTDSSTLMTPERVTQHFEEHHSERTIVSTSTPSGTAPNKSLWLQVS